MAEINLSSYETTNPRIYAYTEPGVTYNVGWLKIGYTASQTVEERIKQQTHSARIKTKIEWVKLSPYCNGKYLIDTDFHKFLTDKYKILRDTDREWFKITPVLALKYFDEFSADKSTKKPQNFIPANYNLREAQINAVDKTLEYYLDDKSPREFLWNAKPRFGKNLAVYELIHQLGANKILIVTNRPAIADSWYRDFIKFNQNHANIYKFVVNKKDNLNAAEVYSYTEFLKLFPNQIMIAFISLQDMKGAKTFGGKFDKLNWIQDLNFDLMVIDESHEGVDTEKTYAAFENIHRDFTLYLSGTPFKAIATNKFRDEQIFNWSYADEQNAKTIWYNNFDKPNPYADLPRMNLFSYQLSKMIVEEISTNEDVNYLFDLNEFFSTKGGKFIHENAIKKFLDALTTQNKFPFATPKLRAELKHTFWLMQRVDSVKAMAKLLQEHNIFSQYKIVIAAGENSSDENSNKKSLDKVKAAIATNNKTITLSVGQLTTGVTVPEWTAVLMLSEMKSPALYMQAAFRAQNPHSYETDNEIFHKTNCYVFDFSPTRTLKIYNDFAQSLSSGGSRQTVENLLNVFPVFAENDAGELIELDAEKILSLPQTLKANSVVDSGFMSNDLFQNISHVFKSPAVKNIVRKFNRDDLKKDITIKPADDNPPKPPKTKGDTPKTKTKKIIDEESDLRARLRGFARTIPSFIMAYGDENLTLQNFENYIDDKTFEDVTGITKADFIFLRDGGVRDGEIFEGGLFDDTVFNLAIKEFLARRKNFSNYFDDTLDKDIFDFIPPQKTSQIFTPRAVVTKMVDALQFENPNIFSNPNQIFFDPYMKSGLYITEIVKRLYHNPNICKIFPDDAARLKHILENQVFGCAPTEIIFRIATNYIFGNHSDISRRNFSVNDILKVITDADFSDFLKNIFTVKVIILNKERVKKFGEVFTPQEIVNLMLDDENIADVFADINAKILEPTAGDGAFLVGILQRKLKLAQNSDDAFSALAAIYGIEIQFDNLAYARKNLADTFTDFHLQHFGDFDKNRMWEIIFRNIVQGDALEFFKDISNLFGKKFFGDLNSAAILENVIVIGNPPYQAETKGDNKTFAAPVYHLFLESFWRNCNRVMMIHPARCLFNAGGTPKAFMKNLLNDEHLKVIHYEPDSSKIFNNVDIKGGVAVTYRNANENFGKIEVFIPFPKLKSVWRKVFYRNDFKSISEIMRGVGIFHYTKKLHEDFPDIVNQMSKGHAFDVKTNALENFPYIFLEEKPNDGYEYIQFLGIVNSKRVYRWIRWDYILDIPLLHKYKIILPKANGSGAIGEKLSTPLVGLPLVGYTETFITLGAFHTEAEAQNCLKYVKTKFARALLGVLKATQELTPEKWKYVPQQDFTAASDVDWSRPIAEIDKYLYQKYNLSKDEVEFVEEKVRAME